MEIFKYNGSGGIDSDESNFTMNEVNLSNGEATISRKIYFRSTQDFEDGADVISMPTFPQKYSAHPKHPNFKYYGNGKVYPIQEKSKIWCAELDYSTTDNNATDADGGKITSETKPWNLLPENITFSYPEVTVPFTAAFDEKGKRFNNQGEVIVPVLNSAGNIIPAETSIRNIQMAFTFNTRDWSFINSIAYGNSINANEITVCGITIPAKSALLVPPEANYITVYKENSTSVKWRYWSININILIDVTGETILKRRFLDIGNNAKFDALNMWNGTAWEKDDFFALAYTKLGQTEWGKKKWGYVSAQSTPGAIFSFRPLKQVGTTTDASGYVHHTFSPEGNVVFCSFEQAVAIRKQYRDCRLFFEERKDKYKIIFDSYEPQFQEQKDIPLNGGFVYTKAIMGAKGYVANTPYKTLSFNEFRPLSWKPLNLPKKGFVKNG